MKHLRFLNKYFYRYRYRFLLGILFIIISNVFGVLSPVVIRLAIDLVGDNISFYRLFSGFSLQSEFYGIFKASLLLFGVTVLLRSEERRVGKECRL